MLTNDYLEFILSILRKVLLFFSCMFTTVKLLAFMCICTKHHIALFAGPLECSALHSYSLKAPGPQANAYRLLRSMQLGRPLLLEGAPGVGKTSLVIALAKASGHPISRINLSEHTVSSYSFLTNTMFYRILCTSCYSNVLSLQQL